MIRSTITANPPGAGYRTLACALALVLAAAAAGPAAAKAPAKTASGKAAQGARNKKPDGRPAPAGASATVPADAVRDWDIVIADKTLNATMARWAASAGWQLLWELPVDYPVQARTRVHGTFEDAVSVVAQSLEAAEIPIKAVFYQGNRVLRVMAKGSE